jgi:NADPH-dependent ferric siderophore reductase
MISTDSQTTPGVQRVRYPLRRRALTVARTRRLGAGFVEITLAGDALGDFASAGFDDHVKLLFPRIHGDNPIRRDYTPRSYDTARGELVIEFALHGDGAASEWARTAVPGDSLEVAGPRGSMIVPLDFDWHLLAGDETALPAISRRLEELPAGARAIVLAQASSPDDERELTTAAQLELAWVRSGPELLARACDLKLPGGNGFVWAAGEAQLMARLRDEILVTKGHPRNASRIAAYWKQGASAHHEQMD